MDEGWRLTWQFVMLLITVNIIVEQDGIPHHTVDTESLLCLCVCAFSLSLILLLSLHRIAPTHSHFLRRFVVTTNHTLYTLKFQVFSDCSVEWGVLYVYAFVANDMCKPQVWLDKVFFLKKHHMWRNIELWQNYNDTKSSISSMKTWILSPKLVIECPSIIIIS